MTDEGGLYFNEGFNPRNINGNVMMEESYGVSGVSKKGDTGYANLATVMAYTNFTDSIQNGTDTLMIDNAGYIYYKQHASPISALYNGQIHNIPNTNGVYLSYYPDILATDNGNFLYTSRGHIGIGYYGRVKTGSSTTKIIDTDSRDWTALGVDTTKGDRNKVTNLRTGVEYTITSISGSGNIEVNFTTSGANDNLENDPFIVWIDSKFQLTALQTAIVITIPRKIYQYGDIYLITNDNYLAYVGDDESTFEAQYKQLPVTYKAKYLTVNGTKVAVSATSPDGGGILLWDGFSDGWLNIMDLDTAPLCVANYKTGFVFLVNNYLLFSDGYQLQKLSTYPDRLPSTVGGGVANGYNSIIIRNDKVFIASSSTNSNRILGGTIIYDFAYGWSYVPAINDSSNTRFNYYTGNTTSIILNNYITQCNDGNISKITNYGQYTETYQNKSFILLADFNTAVNIGAIGLNISSNLSTYLDESVSTIKKTKITVSIGDAHNGIFNYNQVKAGSAASSIIVDGTLTYNEVGNEIQFMDGATSGERSFITAIADKGTTSETWTISPVISGTPTTSSYVRIINVKKTETKTIDADKFNEEIRFNADGFYSNKCFIEVVVHGLAESTPISILDINIY